MSFIMRPVRFASTGHLIQGSGLFQGSSDFLDFTPSSGSAETDFTLEMLVKLAKINSGDWLFSVDVSSNSFFFVYLNTDGTIIIKNQTSGSTNWEYTTIPVFRDTSAWLHLVLSVGTASNNVTLYANGVLVPLTVNTNKAAAATCHINSAFSHEIGDRSNNSNSFDGYYARCTGIMGTTLTAASFGETTRDGYWQIKDASELTFGANGWLLEGGVNIAAGTDSSYTEPTSYIPVPVTFDGTNDYLTRGAALTGEADGKNAILAFWIKRNGNAGSKQNVFGNYNGYMESYFHTDNTFNLLLHNPGGTKITHIKTSAILVDNNWHHIMASVNGTTQHLYLDGVSDSTSSHNVDDVIDLTKGGGDYWAIGSNAEGSGAAKLHADIADMIFDDTYLDLSNSSNRAKFISATGEPVDPGSDASTAIAAGRPLVYMNQNALASWHTNSGTGGGYTENGALTAGPTVRGTGANDFLPVGTITATNDSPTNGDA